MLGQIERGESSPNVAKLWQIASGFDSFIFPALLQRARTMNSRVYFEMLTS